MGPLHVYQILSTDMNFLTVQLLWKERVALGFLFNYAETKYV